MDKTAKKQVDAFREKVTGVKDVQNLVTLFSDISILEGDWTLRYADPKSEFYIKGKQEWGKAKQQLIEDIEDHGYDVSRWSLDSLTTLALTCISVAKVNQIMREVIVALADAKMADERTEIVSEWIKEIVGEEE